MTVEQWLGEDNQIGIDIWHRKYQHNNETFDEWLDRVSAGNQDIKDLIISKKFLFGGRILAYRGLNRENKKISYSNCYVIAPPEDNIESIFECACKLARTYSYGGGCGIDISNLAPAGAKVRNAAESTSGAISFMELYNLVTSLICMQGRRGAMMISISCEHPDLEEFIKIKSDLDKINKANISIKITDKFMKAVENKEMFTLSFTREETGETIKKEVNAFDTFKLICEMNWDYAEPGVIFWDTVNECNLLSEDEEFHYAGMNPCAEEPLPVGGSCLLGSINLSEFVDSNGKFQFELLKNTVNIVVRGMNNVLDEGLPLHPLKEQRDSVRDWRQIGLGIFGLADALIKMEIEYGSSEAVNICNAIGAVIADTAIYTSSKIAEEQKETYPKYKRDCVISSNFFNRNTTEETRKQVKEYGLRNSQLLTIAPTGTLSTMLGVSGGIEPIYENSYMRKTESLFGEDKYYKVYTPIVKKFMEANGLNDESQLPKYFVTAKTINYRKRISMQAIWQKHIDASISSTVNVSNDFTVEQVMNLYRMAWENGLKGVTIFRDGCKRTGILTSVDDKETETEEGFKYNSITPITRKELGSPLSGNTYIKKVACGKMYITINHDSEGRLLEVFVNSGKSGGCSANTDCLGRYASAAMRSGVRIKDIIDITKGVKCPACISAKGKGTKLDGISCGDVIARTIQEEYNLLNGEKQEVKKPITLEQSIVEHKNSIPCPECGVPLTNEGGCVVCKTCGWSKCN